MYRDYRVSGLIDNQSKNINQNLLASAERERIYNKLQSELGGDNWYHSSGGDYLTARGGASSEALEGFSSAGNESGTFLSAKMPWWQEGLVGKNTIFEFPKETFGDLKSTNWQGYPSNESAMEIGDRLLNYKLGPVTAEDYGMVPLMRWEEGMALNNG